MGRNRRRPDDSRSERVRGRRQDDLHDQHRLVGHAADDHRSRHQPRFYKEVVRSGYRGPYFRAIAADVAAGGLDLEELLDPELPDDEVAARLLALPGVGPYATAQILMLLGRYSRLILDSWSRPKYAQLNGRKATDKTIERRFRRYKHYAGLAFWLYVTRDWVAEPAGIK
ncbi:MAG: hypothetical protein E6G38_09410 [Actinobacteria bacterium]|nr:MAG: hypothetical protein E6G38_09410 [Actinomycetota bacterium]